MDDSSQSTLAEPDLLSMLSNGNAEEVSKACEALRRTLSQNPVTIDLHAAASAVLSVLERHTSSLRIAHLAVAALAHPALNPAVVSPCVHPETPVLRALERLSMSAAFVHTALAALQNAACASACPRDAVLTAVVSAMRQHSSHTGILLRGADLVAFHLNQPIAQPSAHTFEMAAAVVVAASPKLSATPQGASAGLMSLVAAAKYAALSNASQTPATARFSRGVSAFAPSIVDQPFAATVVAIMNRHKEFAAVQVLACELIRVAASGPSAPAKSAAREFFAAQALTFVIAASQVHRTDDNVIERAIAAIRALLLLGEAGSHARLVKPTVALSGAGVDTVISVLEEAATAMLHKNPDVAAAAKVLAVDVRIASTSTNNNWTADSAGNRSARDSRQFSVSQMGRKLARSLRMSSRLKPLSSMSPASSRQSSRPIHLSDKGYASGHIIGASTPPSFQHHHHHHHYGPNKYAYARNAAAKHMSHDKTLGGVALHGKSLSNGTSPTHSSRRTPPSAASSSMISTRSSMAHDFSGFTFPTRNKEPAPAVDRFELSDVMDGVSSNGASGDFRQSSSHRRWRSVGGLWNFRSRRNGSLGFSSPPPSSSRRNRKDRRGPLTMSGSDVANLSRQPSQRQFGMGDQMEYKAHTSPLRRKRQTFMSFGDGDSGF